MRAIKFVLTRTFTLVLVLFIGMTVVFFIPRLMPTDPIDRALGQMQAESGRLDAEEYENMRKVLAQNYGLEGTLWEQYSSYIKRVVLTQDFGASFSNYPTPVSVLIVKALPWTLGLMLTSTFIAWIIGNFIGLMAGFRKEKLSSKILEYISVVLYPLPYYVFALLLIMLFAYIIPIFPLNTIVRGTPWTWDYIAKIFECSFLPAMSNILVMLGWWTISMKTLTTGILQEDYITFAKMKGLSKRRIMWGYIAPNAALPQVTAIALRLGQVFSGSMIVEILFSYPGMGTLIYNAIVKADYNLIMGTITISILAVAIAAYAVDLIYPFIDPRIRLK